MTDFLNQDLSYPLFQWFANKPDARRLVRERVKEIEMKVKTSELIGPQLDWAVAKAEGHTFTYGDHERNTTDDTIWLRGGSSIERRYSTDWCYGGPIIEREKLTVRPSQHYTTGWESCTRNGLHFSLGPTPLIAAMRCYVASKLGDEVDIPEELK
jgi:Protein of unknown function (DUF2591)